MFGRTYDLFDSRISSLPYLTSGRISGSKKAGLSGVISRQPKFGTVGYPGHPGHPYLFNPNIRGIGEKSPTFVQNNFTP